MMFRVCRYRILFSIICSIRVALRLVKEFLVMMRLKSFLLVVSFIIMYIRFCVLNIFISWMMLVWRIRRSIRNFDLYIFRFFRYLVLIILMVYGCRVVRCFIRIIRLKLFRLIRVLMLYLVVIRGLNLVLYLVILGLRGGFEGCFVWSVVGVSG